MDHYDLMFQVMCTKGYPVSLENACKGFGLTGKLSGVHGAQAPAMWAAGEREKVMAYCAQDTVATLDVVLATTRERTFRWVSKSGRPNKFSCPEILTVRQALAMPVPDTSWMTTPMQRAQFTSWFPGAEPRLEPGESTTPQAAGSAFEFVTPEPLE